MSVVAVSGINHGNSHAVIEMVLKPYLYRVNGRAFIGFTFLSINAMKADVLATLPV